VKPMHQSSALPRTAQRDWYCEVGHCRVILERTLNSQVGFHEVGNCVGASRRLRARSRRGATPGRTQPKHAPAEPS